MHLNDLHCDSSCISLILLYICLYLKYVAKLLLVIQKWDNITDTVHILTYALDPFIQAIWFYCEHLWLWDQFELSLILQITGHPVNARLWFAQSLTVVFPTSFTMPLFVPVSPSFLFWGGSQSVSRWVSELREPSPVWSNCQHLGLTAKIEGHYGTVSSPHLYLPPELTESQLHNERRCTHSWAWITRLPTQTNLSVMVTENDFLSAQSAMPA